MSISSISNVSRRNLYQNYRQLASGKRINSAADDAAGLSIAEKLRTQRNGYDVGRRNAATSKDMVNVAWAYRHLIPRFMAILSEMLCSRRLTS